MCVCVCVCVRSPRSYNIAYVCMVRFQNFLLILLKLAIHMSSHDCKPLQQQQRLSAATGAKKQTQMSKQCAVKNCKEKDAIGVGLVRCPLCRKEYCLRYRAHIHVTLVNSIVDVYRHRLENAHKCPRAGDTRAARRAADQRAVMQRQRQQQDTGSDDCLIL